MRVFGEHDEEVFVVLPREHRVAATDAAGKKRHAFVLHGVAIQREHAEVQEIERLDELREDDAPIVGGVSGVVDDAAVVFRETHEPRVFDAITLIRRDGENDAFAHRELRRKAQLVVRVGEPADALERAAQVAMDRFRFRPHAAHAFIELLEREIFPERLQHIRRVAIFKTHLLEFQREAFLFVSGIRHDLRHGDETRHGIDGHRAVRRDDARAKFDGGNVALARGAQAHRKTQIARRHVGLIRMRDDGRIKKRGGFQRVFAGKKRADEKLARARKQQLSANVPAHFFKMREEQRLDVEVPRGKVIV